MRSAFVYNFLIEANIMASIAIILMIPLRKFFRKQLGNSAICFGWLLVAIRLLCPLSLVNPLIHEIRSPFAADVAIRPIAGQIKVRVSDALEGLSRVFWHADNQSAYEVTNRLQDGIENASASITLAKIWLVGVLLVIAWLRERKYHTGEDLAGRRSAGYCVVSLLQYPFPYAAPCGSDRTDYRRTERSV